SLHSSPAHHDLHSFPTRRSSDLDAPANWPRWSASGNSREGEKDPEKVRKSGRDAIFPFNKRLLTTLYSVTKPASLIIVSRQLRLDRKSTRLNSSHVAISYAVFCL